MLRRMNPPATPFLTTQGSGPPQAPAPNIQTSGLMQMQSATAEAALAGPTIKDIATPSLPTWVKALGVVVALGLLTLLITVVLPKAKQLR